MKRLDRKQLSSSGGWRWFPEFELSRKTSTGKIHCLKGVGAAVSWNCLFRFKETSVI